MAPCLLPLLSSGKGWIPAERPPVPLSADAHLAYPMPPDGNMVLGDACSYPDENGAPVGGHCPSCAWEGLDYILSTFSPTCTMQLCGEI